MTVSAPSRAVEQELDWLTNLVPNALSAVRAALAKGSERLAVELAIRQGVADESRLADLVFYARHPERVGRPIQRGEQALAREWTEIRDHVVRPALAGRPPAPTGPATGARLIPVETPGGGRIADKRDPAPADVVSVRGVSGTVPLHRLAADAWTAMVAAARAAGLAEPLLLPTSGYRSAQRQAELWEEAKRRYGSEAEARKWVAPPGGSPHQSGRAMDLYVGGRNDSSNVDQLRRLPAYAWLAANAARFGFYPYDREPWHWEYNPPARTEQELGPVESELFLGSIGGAIDRASEWASVRLALLRGTRDEDKLTDLVFHGRHPERQGRALAASERDLIREWLEIRDTIVRPLLSGGATSPAPAPAPAPVPGQFVKDAPQLRAITLAPARPVAVESGWSSTLKSLAGAYNRLGGLMGALAAQLGIEVRAMLAVWYVESAGRAHVPGRAIIRFENHLLWRAWGEANAATYDRYFKHGGHAGVPGQSWENHAFRESPDQAFRPLHSQQADEYAVLAVATRLAGETVALQCISIGGPQILGSNHRLLGYATPRTMYDAFQADERWHVLGFIDYCRGRDAPGRGDLIRHLAAHDWRSFARYYNGSGQVDYYGGRIGDHYALAGQIGVSG
jgi:hypothetical protein